MYFPVFSNIQNIHFQFFVFFFFFIYIVKFVVRILPNGLQDGSMSHPGTAGPRRCAQFWCLFMCRARWSEREKLRLHTPHWKGLAPVCFR